MPHLEEVHIAPHPLQLFVPLVGDAEVLRVQSEAAAWRDRVEGRTIWHVNSTSRGGGVAELLRSLLAFARGAGIDTRWLVIRGTPDFFSITKRLHNALHGEPGDGSSLDERAHEVYEQVLCENAQELLAIVRPGDTVTLHDPQTIGLARWLRRSGVQVVWRCHIGVDTPNAQSELGWKFLERYLADAHVYVFSRQAYVPAILAKRPVAIIAPSIDPFSAKNQPMEDRVVRSMLLCTGVVGGEPDETVPIFHRDDGTPARVDRAVDVMRLGPAPHWSCRTIVQVSRWDRLKDPVGVLRGFARFAEWNTDVHLLLVGPNVHGVADDPEGAAVFDEVAAAWRSLPHGVRRRAHLVNVPTADIEENAAIVNAVQRHASVVVQKSLKEGFGLTVTEAMWKSRPVVASDVGGIHDQIVDGESGLLLRDPTDAGEFAVALETIIGDRNRARAIGESAHERVKKNYLGVRTMLDYATMLAQLDAVG